MKKSSFSPVSEPTLSLGAAHCHRGFLWLASRERLGWGRAGLEISQAVGMGHLPLLQRTACCAGRSSYFSVSCQLGGSPQALPRKSKCFPNLARDGLPVLSVLQPPPPPHTASTHPGASFSNLPTPLQIPCRMKSCPCSPFHALGWATIAVATATREHSSSGSTG